ncbi:FAD-dependent oxidoreductase [Thermobifida fusca]|jgi:2,4-dienoyl-CoA reductase-like NADH-dependent reductase (Old Yellow Enzyme family)/thioredoxin reductase|uniref:NADH:flavin oxidoreductase n=2 Tax=Thermobifida fusca TaxID=2021 RepID=A0A9P2TAT0_THEFU|nr:MULTISPECIES: FAD-dependent oxidoreductase [Thermobifida]AAZ55341.1 NADH:flavin oxidoreductases, Old Yellow enzyme family [Thermobifida fusca YX]EOR71592.1 NADH:flavin oxidoreductase [Thermobifida fusca TM51]MBO2528612.1 NADH:flavin oxidoreductase [Thermobifida sp.]MDD6793515.1 FAD-dependent oxidoreductase [Thermobifida fusca]PPS93168.1 NADH:flavin oxidoreductase [Thermobifida fusca]
MRSTPNQQENSVPTGDGTRFPHLFSPFQIGPMRLRNRVMAPPHSSAIGNLWGTDEKEVERTFAYWRSRVSGDGPAWVGGVTGRVRNILIPGFEPHGYGAETTGYFRQPFYVERIGRFVEEMHALGAVVTTQLTLLGGVPHAPSPRRSSTLYNHRPHVLSTHEIAEFVEEYRFSASQARKAGLDGIELHLNHDDLLEWFLSPLTNQRTDAYGGSLENRARFAVEVLTAVREEIGSDMALGVRFNLREEEPGGYTLADGIEIAQYLESTGLLDFLHAVIGSPWGDPSYIQPYFYQPAQWADLAGQLRRSVSLPVIYTGRINSVEVAEKVLADGNADVVGMARAFIADGDILRKAREGRLADIRPCVGGNECITRRYVDKLPFGCAVNPHTSNEIDGPWKQAANPRRILVVGGGPAGMELAALTAESGHTVELWEATDKLGGQLRTILNAPFQEQMARYLEWQERRLEKAGVTVRRNTRATADTVAEAGFDVVAVATGARPRRPAEIEGVDQDYFVYDIRDVLLGNVAVGQEVLVVAQDDHLPPLIVADYLSDRGHDVTIVYPTAGPAPMLGRYILGGMLARLTSRGVQFRFMEDVIGIEEERIRIRHTYSHQESELGAFDSVVLACGGDADSSLYEELRGRVPELHILGDAFAPTRLVAVTRQAYALAKELQK